MSSSSSHRGDLAEPVPERRLVEGSRSRAETSSQRLSAVSSIWCSTPFSTLLGRLRAAASIAASQQAVSMRISRPRPERKRRYLQGVITSPHGSPQLWKARWAARRSAALSTAFRAGSACGQPAAKRSGYTRPRLGRAESRQPVTLSSDETDLSAKRTPAEAEARLPRPHVHAGRAARSSSAAARRAASACRRS